MSVNTNRVVSTCKMKSATEVSRYYKVYDQLHAWHGCNIYVTDELSCDAAQ